MKKYIIIAVAVVSIAVVYYYFFYKKGGIPISDGSDYKPVSNLTALKPVIAKSSLLKAPTKKLPSTVKVSSLFGKMQSLRNPVPTSTPLI